MTFQMILVLLPIISFQSLICPVKASKDHYNLNLNLQVWMLILVHAELYCFIGCHLFLYLTNLYKSFSKNQIYNKNKEVIINSLNKSRAPQEMSNNPQLGGPNNPANKRKFIQSEVDLKQLIIIDNGTQSVKIGRSGMDYPSIIIPTIAGYPHVISQNDVATPKRVYFGKDLRQVIDSKRYNVEFFYPIEHSRIAEKGLDQMIDLWEYVLVEIMGVEPANAELLIIDSAQNTKQYKAKIIELLFQKLKVASVLFMNSSVLSLFSVGSTIGLVTEIGHGTTTVVPVYEGFVLNHALQVSNIAGKKITQILEGELKKSKISFESKDELQYIQIVKKIKQQNIKIAYDYQNQLSNDQRTQQQRSYQLPDGSIIHFSKSCVYSPGEILFTSSQPSLPQMIQTSLDRCNQQLRVQLMKNMIFCGGCSMIPGMEERVNRELSNSTEEMRVQFDWQRRYSSWIGGSMIGSLSVFQQLAITNGEHSTNEIIKRIL